MSAPINTTISRAAQIGLAAGAGYLGYQGASAMVRTAYRDDLLGDPNRIVENDGERIIFQERDPDGGDGLRNAMMVAGTVTAATGGILFGGGDAAATGVRALVRTHGGPVLFTLGVGAIAGALATSKQYMGSDFANVD